MTMDCSNGFWCFQLKDLINTLILGTTIVAILYGPIWAVKITRRLEDEREKRRRQYEIFHSLMKTRRVTLSPEHVMALNLVQIEFYGQERIVNAYKRYLENLSTEVPKEQGPLEKFFDDRDDLLFELLHEIGNVLGFVLDRRELHKFSYAPQGWNNDETQLRQFRLLAIDLLSGRRALPVFQYQAAEANKKFPPPPQQE
ncbi:DUF6680 family protein [Terrarubrum flagellatum]|uniref:DUF6680 family protein n=1 Tax=Terrirubrum flagellatum TaxID=2895980 RepID=UPI003144EB05